MTGRRIAFVGPTLTPSERPDAGITYLPAVRHGDLFALDLCSDDRILMVDGVYQHFAPVRHKEILAMLTRGVHVSGAASLGALRAAELHPFGMTGSGAVYAAARAGTLVADADVGVLQSPDEDGAQRLTVAAVSVRQGVTELFTTGALTRAEAAVIRSTADGLHFTERSPHALLNRAGTHRPAMRRLLDHLARHGDIKARDALEALAFLAAPGPTGPPDMPATTGSSPVWRSSYGSEWAFEHTPLRPGSTVTGRQALAFLQLFDADFPRRHLRYVRAEAAASCGLGPDASAADLLAAAGFAPPLPDAPLAAPTTATADWTPHERLLARTFRLGPGRLTYTTLSPEALGDVTTEEVEQWCVRCAAPAGKPSVPTSRWHALLRRLWHADHPEQYRLAASERGLRDTAEAARLAAAFAPALASHMARPLGAR